MMPNISRGDSMSGLMVYLAGPGRHNEHTEPHLVAGDSSVLAWYDDTVLDRQAAVDIAKVLDQPRRFYDVEVPQGSVWHCSLSIKAEDGPLTDAQWQSIAQDFMDEMGFTETSGKAPARWVAVRHGLSAAGNDHVHIAASWVREDATKMFIRNDWARSQQVVADLERKHGLVQLESRTQGAGVRGFARADAEISKREGRPEPKRVELARTVLACATASVDEGEFVRRARQHGLLVRPRFVAGTQDVVAGYSVAVKPPAGEKPVWFGGGQLGKDLSLPRLRQGWTNTPESATAAVGEWQAAWRGRGAVTPGREMQQIDTSVLRTRADEIGQLRNQLRAVPAGDRAAWSTVARQTSAVFAAWSARTEQVPGPLAETARLLARYGSGKVAPQTPHRPVLGAMTMTLLQGGVGSDAMATALMLRQLTNMMKSIHDAQLARGEAVSAADVERSVRRTLDVVRRELPALPVPDSPVAASGGAVKTARVAGAVTRADADGTPVAVPRPPRRQQSVKRPTETPARNDSPVPNRLPERQSSTFTPPPTQEPTRGRTR